jgi:PAS domain S-box-containing protein
MGFLFSRRFVWLCALALALGGAATALLMYLWISEHTALEAPHGRLWDFLAKWAGPMPVYSLLALFLGMVFLSLLTMVMALKYGRAVAVERELAAEKQLKELAQRFALVTRHANDIILIADTEGAIIDANERAIESYGRSLDELKTMRLGQLRAPDSLSDLAGQMTQLMNQGFLVYETVHQSAGGHAFPVEISSRLVTLGGEKAQLAIVRDVTGRKQQDAELLRMTHLYEALSQVNRMLLRVHEPMEIFQQLCRIMVENGRFWLVWIGRYDREHSLVVPLVCEGEEKEFLTGFTLSTSGPRERRPPSVVAVLEGRGDVCRDFSTIDLQPWQERLARFRFRSSASFPIRQRGVVWGNLTVYSLDPDNFGEREAGLLEAAAGEVSRALDEIADQRAHVRIEAALRESELKFRTLFETMPEMVAIHEMVLGGDGRPVDYRILDCNTAFCLALGHPRERVVGLLASRLFGGRVPHLAEFGRVVAGGPPLSFEVSSGFLERHVRVSAASPAPGRFAVVITDMTERRQSEERLRESEERYRRLTGAVTDYVFTVHLREDGSSETTHSPGCIAVTGYAPEDFHGNPNLWLEMVNPEDRNLVLQQAQRVRGGSPLESIEHRLRCKDGRERWVRNTISAHRDAAGTLLSYDGLLKDITERKESELRLREANEQLSRYATQMESLVKGRTADLEAAVQELEAFSYSVSHDLQAPLRAMTGCTQIILEDHGAGLNDEVRRLLGLVSKEGTRMGRLIDDLLCLSRYGRQALHPFLVDMQLLVEEVRAELMVQHEGRQVEWRIASLPKVTADPIFLRQVWLNLLGNALKYTRQRGVAVIEVNAEERPGEFLYQVSDNGAGFDMRQATKLFGVFQRLHGEEQFEGTGVGLALVQRIVQRHGGKVEAWGEEGKGARFSFTLPR